MSAGLVRIRLIGILIAPLAVAEGQSHSEDHKSDRWNKQHQNRAIERLLPLLGGAPSVCIAHGAALSEGGQRKNTEHREQGERASFTAN